MKSGELKKIGGNRTGWRLPDSGAEGDRSKELKEREKTGEIKDLREQSVIELEPGVKYRPDFDYLEAGRRVYEDVKGPMSQRMRIIIHLWKLHGPGPLRLLARRGRGRPFHVTRNIPGGKA